MTNENIIEIKSQRKYWFLQGIFTLLLMLASLFIALLPLISAFASANSMMFCISGGIAFVAFTAYFVYLLYKECKPDNALILTTHGFTDRKNVGDGIEIEWTNVSGVKMLGKANMPFLGITLENADIILAKMKKYEAAEMRENIDQNLPTILIPQSAVRTPIKELKDLFVKFVREARALENDTPKKPKNNPFTTDDVLRAFGHLPKEDAENAPEAKFDTKIAEPFTVPDEVEAPVEDTAEKKHLSASDSFYETLRTKASVKSDSSNAKQDDANTQEQADENNVAPAESAESKGIDNANEDSENTDMPDEIKELLSRAKSSRIAELEKILTDADVPYSLSRKESEKADCDESSKGADSSDIDVDEDEKFDDAVLADENADSFDNEYDEEDDIDERASEESEDVDGADESNVDDVEIDHDDGEDDNYDVADDGESAPENDDGDGDSPFELTLDSMIKSALKAPEDDSENQKSTSVKEIKAQEHDSNGDTKEFVLDLSNAIAAKTKKDGNPDGDN